MVAKVAVGLAVLGTGFFALSDDDYSRVVIAQRFAHSPTLDPSGTSWLPLPFWLTGGAMAMLGRSLAVARGVALVSGVASVLLVHRAARWCGVSPAAALLGALIAGTLPTAARLGVSYPPEALTTGLVVLGAASANLPGSRRLLGAAALFAACLCRYEAWAAAAALAVMSLSRSSASAPASARSSSADPSGGVTASPPTGHAAGTGSAGSPTRPSLADRDLFLQDRSDLAATGAPTPVASRPAAPASASVLAPALISLAAPLLWILHGAVNHGDALFFLHRVAAYRRALGGPESALSALASHPVALVMDEPELLLGVLALLVGWRLASAELARPLSRWKRPTLVIGAVFAFLVVGSWMDGSATHHLGRTLLPVWTLLALVGADVALRLPAAGKVRRNVSMALGAALVAGLVIRSRAPSDSFAPRQEERAIGSVARRHVSGSAPPLLLIDTHDYGYFAVLAAYGAPERAEPFLTHDPRDGATADPFTDAETLARTLDARGARFFVARSEHLPTSVQVGTIVERTRAFALVEANTRR